MPEHKKPGQMTMKDVAEAAGVSVMSVSNVVNERWDLISERTRTKIEKEIKRLQYQPQHAGRSLRTGKTNTIGLLVIQERNVAERLRLRNQSLVAGFLDAVSAQGYTIYPTIRHGATMATSLAAMSQRLDALAIRADSSSRMTAKDLSTLRSLNIPVIELQSFCMSGLDDVCTVHESVDSRINMLATLLGRGERHEAYQLAPLAPHPFAERRLRLLKSNPSCNTMKFHSGLDIDLLIERLRDPEAAARTAIIITESEQDALRLITTASGLLSPDILSRVFCLDLNEGSARDPYFKVASGLVSVAYRVGLVAGRTLLTRLSNQTFAYRDIAVDSEIFLTGAFEDDK